MKKTFLFVFAALTSLAMWAGENDLLWDYTEAAPSSNPDKGLTYGSKVNDAAGTQNGLKGIKMDGSGYCYFTKAAVAGKLKLTYSARSGNSETWLKVSQFPEGETPSTSNLTLIAETEHFTELRTATVELSAEQNNIYIQRGSGVQSVLTKIQFVENVARTFTDFKIEFRENPYTVLLPEGGELPQGVSVEGTTYNGGQHGVQGGTITVPVDGPVKFTLGACQFSTTPITIKKDGVDFATFSNKAACGETAGNFAQNVLYVYTGDAATLTFELGSQTYLPYFFAEATEITPCDVIFKDQNGKTLGKIETYEGANLTVLPYSESDLTIPEGEVFRGWFYTSGKKAVIGDAITGNTTITAKVTPVETATVGSVQTYDFASAIFYPEDHETVTANGGSFHDPTHGWYFNADGSIDIQVAGNAIVNVTLCTYSESGDVILKNGETEIGRTTVVKNGSEGATPDGAEYSYKYTGEATTLTLSWTAKQYIHKIVVYNVLDFLEKDAATGYFIVPAGDAACFLLALVQAESGDKIFLPNGTYDLGETVLTAISKDNISIIGQSMEGTIIKNAPDFKTESIDNTATLKINKKVKNTYLQDLTLQNALDYYKNNNGRAVCLQDQGTQTICKNVKMLSYQDTYYSNLIGAVKYFETSEIHGTVDFICGDGSVYFKNTELVCEQRSTSGGGSDALTASNADASDKGYVFEGCSVRYADNIEGTKPVVSLGRSWNHKPKTVFLNTLLADDLVMTKDADAQKDKIQRWTCGGMNILPELFGEYNSVDKNGNVVSPASNNVTFVLNSDEKQMETILTAEQAATYTMEYTLGAWAETAKADATQIMLYKTPKRWIIFISDGTEIKPEVTAYLVERDGVASIETELPDWHGEENIIIRAANGRGGFGYPATYGPEEAIDNTDAYNNKVEKVIRDGQVVIVRDGKEFNVLGAEL